MTGDASDFETLRSLGNAAFKEAVYPKVASAYAGGGLLKQTCVLNSLAGHLITYMVRE